MKRETRIKLFLLLFSIATLLFLWLGLDFNVHTTTLVEAMSEQATVESLKAERQQRKGELHLDIFFNEQKLVFDKRTNTYFYPIVGEGVQAFNPRIEMQAHNDTHYQVILTGSPITPMSIRENQQQAIFVYGKDWYQEFNLAVTTLPVIAIQLDDPIVNQEVDLDYKDATISLVDTNPNSTPTQQHIVTKAQVRYRGASSLMYPQKQLRLSLKVMSLGRNIRNNHLSLLGMREDDDWILYAAYSDPEKARNTLSNNLWFDSMADNNRFGIKNGTEGKYVEVFINNEYWGIYTLMHPIDAKQLALVEDEDPNKSDYFYRLISNDAVAYEQYDGSLDEDVIPPVEVRYPKKNSNHTAKWAPFVKHQQMLLSSAMENAAYMKEQTDIENVIDYWLFFNLTQAFDNGLKNRNYVAKFDGEKHVVLESPWDLDLTWGNVWDDPYNLETVFIESVESMPYVYPSFITTHLEQGSLEIIAHIIERYTELRGTTWSDEAMLVRLEQTERDIYDSGAILRNHERWPEAAFNESMEFFNNFVMERLQVMDRYIYEEIGGNSE